MEDEEKLHSEGTPLTPRKDETADKPPSYSEKEVEAQPTSEQSEGKVPPPFKRHFSVDYMKLQVLKARKESSNKGVLALKIFGILCGSALSSICFLALAALPIAMIVIGAHFLHDCPGRDKIPIWLIVFGCFSLLLTIFDLIKQCCGCAASNNGGDKEKKKDWGENTDSGCGCCQSLIILFLIAWIITGSVWVFGYWDQFQATRDVPCVPPNNCCHSVPYLFSFISLIVIYAIGILSCVIGCCCACICMCFFATAAAVSS